LSKDRLQYQTCIRCSAQLKSVTVNHVICTTDIFRIVEFHIENLCAIERRLRANGTTNVQPNDRE